MKKICLFLAVVLPSLLLNDVLGQSLQGTVVYEKSISINVDASEELASLPESILEMIRNNKEYMELLYTEDKLLYRAQPKTKQPISSSGAGMLQVSTSLSNENDITFTDLVNRKIISQKNFMNRQFLIEDTLRTYKWHLTGRTKNIIGYNCQEAYIESVVNESVDTIYAWFTNEIAISTGPENFNGLPGMILELQIGKTQKIVATEVKKDVDLKLLTAPRKGKRISSEAYHEMILKKAEEMKASLGGSNIKVMTIRN